MTVDIDWVNEDFAFDHVGIAVNSIEEGLPFYQALGLKNIQYETVESEKVRVAMLTLANSAKIELLESSDSSGPIARYIEKRGTGIHHICLRVKDIDSTLENLKSKGIRLLNEIPKKGAHNCLVAFVHPKSAGGVLVELSEPQEG
ncbi:MAG: methylmalonyl-CoA epimerase [Bdellovibrionales bacterium]|nr:methylmalonyl-CoA epimerase [Bdellovibrionales bacterium]